MYKIFGYYICEKMEVPNFLGLDKDAIISVSECFGGIHPDLTCCFFINNRKKEHTAYREKWNIDNQKAARLQNDIGQIFESELAIDGRFRKLTDTGYFYETYFKENCMVVSVSTTEEYYNILMSDLVEDTGSINGNGFSSEIVDTNELIGYDILGWDIGGFHTFLCNDLHKELKHVRFNDFCLMKNTFEEVEEFARAIQGKGEPVTWIPCRIGRCEVQGI